jgi:hypothetical protein
MDRRTQGGDLMFFILAVIIAPLVLLSELLKISK